MLLCRKWQYSCPRCGYYTRTGHSQDKENNVLPKWQTKNVQAEHFKRQTRHAAPPVTKKHLVETEHDGEHCIYTYSQGEARESMLGWVLWHEAQVPVNIYEFLWKYAFYRSKWGFTGWTIHTGKVKTAPPASLLCGSPPSLEERKMRHLATSACNPSTWKAETRRWEVWVQPGTKGQVWGRHGWNCISESCLKKWNIL